MVRWPDGIEAGRFFQKDAPSHMPEWIPTFRTQVSTRESPRRKKWVNFPIVNDELALLWMVNMGCIDMNAWYSRVDKPDRPDFVLFDLDPSPDVGFKETVQVALLVKQALDAFGLVGFPKTSSAEGMHAVALGRGERGSRPALVHDAGRARTRAQARRFVRGRADDEAAPDGRAEKRSPGRGDAEDGEPPVRLLLREDRLERCDAARVEGRAGLISQEAEGSILTPRRAVDARRDQRVVDVAHGEDPRVEREVALGEATRVALAVEAFVVVADELVNRCGKAAQLAQQLHATLGMPLDRGELFLVQGGRLLQDPLGNRELADVVEQAADCEGAETSGREPELLADLHGAHCHPAGVLFRGLVLVGEELRQRVHACAQKGLLLGDEVSRAQVAYERARLRGAPQVDGDGDPDDDDAGELEEVSEPPAEIHVVQEQRG